MQVLHFKIHHEMKGNEKRLALIKNDQKKNLKSKKKRHRNEHFLLIAA